MASTNDAPANNDKSTPKAEKGKAVVDPGLEATKDSAGSVADPIADPIAAAGMTRGDFGADPSAGVGASAVANVGVSGHTVPSPAGNEQPAHPEVEK